MPDVLTDTAPSDASTATRRGQAVLVALGLAGLALGRVLRGSPRRGGRRSRGWGPLLIAGVAAVALLRRRRRRVGEIIRSLEEPREPAGARPLEERLDEAVEETFPASDPIAVHIE